MVGLPKALKLALFGLTFFLFGVALGAGGFYFYATKVLVPKYKTQMMNEMFSGGEPEWGDFFKKVEEEETEYANPFEGAEEVGEEEYVNPFELIEE